MYCADDAAVTCDHHAFAGDAAHHKVHVVHKGRRGHAIVVLGSSLQAHNRARLDRFYRCFIRTICCSCDRTGETKLLGLCQCRFGGTFAIKLSAYRYGIGLFFRGSLWEGDRVFFSLMEESTEPFSLLLRYEGERLVESRLGGDELFTDE